MSSVNSAGNQDFFDYVIGGDSLRGRILQNNQDPTPSSSETAAISTDICLPDERPVFNSTSPAIRLLPFPDPIGEVARSANQPFSSEVAIYQPTSISEARQTPFALRMTLDGRGPQLTNEQIHSLFSLQQQATQGEETALVLRSSTMALPAMCPADESSAVNSRIVCLIPEAGSLEVAGQDNSTSLVPCFSTDIIRRGSDTKTTTGGYMTPLDSNLFNGNKWDGIIGGQYLAEKVLSQSMGGEASPTPSLTPVPETAELPFVANNTLPIANNATTPSFENVNENPFALPRSGTSSTPPEFNQEATPEDGTASSSGFTFAEEGTCQDNWASRLLNINICDYSRWVDKAVLGGSTALASTYLITKGIANYKNSKTLLGRAGGVAVSTLGLGVLAAGSYLTYKA